MRLQHGKKDGRTMKLIRAKNYDEMSGMAALMIAEGIRAKPDLMLGLATGTSVEGIYDRLVEQYRENILDFSKVKTVNLDEYLGMDAANQHSYRFFMEEKLFKHINILQENTHVPNGVAPDIREECRRYDEIIEKNGGIDLQLLGIGKNGHVGFNEPAECFYRSTHVVTLAPSTIESNSRFFESMEEVPRQSITMGLGTIMCARRIILVASGEKKAKALEEAFFGNIHPGMPASILQLHNDVTVIADEDALICFHMHK
jgi:glucosamine-6-phosphate deaminase